MSDVEHRGPVVRPSARMWASSLLSAGALGGVAGAALGRGGPRPVPLVLLGLAVVLGTVVLVDLPRVTAFDAEGLTRRCLLRRHRIPWDHVVAIERTRSRIAGPGAGGLVARGRRGRWLLSDRAEPPAVHDELRRLVAASAPSVRWLAPEPTVTTDP